MAQHQCAAKERRPLYNQFLRVLRLLGYVLESRAVQRLQQRGAEHRNATSGRLAIAEDVLTFR